MWAVAVACRTRPKGHDEGRCITLAPTPSMQSIGRPATRTPDMRPTEVFMDAEQLKLLAGRLADWLTHNQHPVKHGHALDFMAAIPGLRNWPEVLSFPERVANAELTELACQRLAQRITKKTGVTFSAQELRAALVAPSSEVASLTVWPDGPAAGVYVTDSQAAVEAVIARYEAA